MADRLMRHLAGVTVCGLLMGGLASVAGCDKLPWSSSDKTQEAATAAAPTAQSAVVPARPSVLPGDVLATVNGVPISRHDAEFRIQELKAIVANLKQTWTPLSTQDLERVLDELVSNELMSQDAAARGLERSSDTQRRWEFTRRAFFVQEWLRWNQDRLNVTEDEIKKSYEEYKLGFRVPERRRLRQLVADTQEQAKQALARLLGESADFAALAQQISVGPTAAEGGLLPGWVMRANEKAFVYASEGDAAAAGVTSLDPGLEAAAFAIDQVNGLSSYVKGADGRFHIFQLVEREEQRQRPLLEVRDFINNSLLVQKLQGAIKDLETKAKVERFPERLEAVAQ